MAASNYQACLKEILKHEGGYVNHPADPGGETNYGITKATAQAYGYHGSMRAIPMQTVEEIYRRRYWHSEAGSCDRLAHGVDLATFDFAVNSGPGRAWKTLKASVGGPDVETVKTLCAKRMGFLRALGTWGSFGKGWTRRLASVEAVGVRMALQAAGRPAEKVRKELQQEAGNAQNSATANGKKAGGAIAAEGAKDTGAAAVDLSSLDWTGWLVFGLVTAAIIVAAVYFIRKWIENRARAEAYSQAAKEV